ncbi:hypothetical protein J0H58_21070 [bacterium]|nr:hypothetical protein [bacterium]
MITLALFASRGPLGPTYLTCTLLLLFLLWPLIVLAIAARSLLSNEPVARRPLAVVVLGATGVGFLIWQEGFARNVSGVWVAWQLAIVGSALLTPVIVEALKRGWVKRPW